MHYHDAAAALETQIHQIITGADYRTFIYSEHFTEEKSTSMAILFVSHGFYISFVIERDECRPFIMKH